MARAWPTSPSWSALNKVDALDPAAPRQRARDRRSANGVRASGSCSLSGVTGEGVTACCAPPGRGVGAARAAAGAAPERRRRWRP